MAAFCSLVSPSRRGCLLPQSLSRIAAAWLCIVLALGCGEQSAGVEDGTLSEALVVSPVQIDFGELGLGEVVTRVVAIRNAGSRTLHLLEPNRDCGCTLAKLEAKHLEPGQRTTMQVEFRAPYRPGPLAKHVSLSCREFPGAETPVGLAARVTARIWAEPNAVEIEIPRGGTGTASVTLHHLPNVRIARVECAAPEVNLETREAGDAARKVTLRIDGTALGSHEVIDGRLEVFLDSETAPAFYVPVRWRARSKIRFAPGNLMVVRRDGRLQRTVSVLLDADIRPESLQISALLPGVEVVSQKTQGRRVVLSLAVDTHRFSPGRHASAVRASTQDGEEEDHMSVVCVPAE